MRELPSLSHPNVFSPLTKRSQTDKMATLKRNDILRKHTNRGRPPKPVKERQLKQRAAYQWRDARRIYLAGSFERWRKLKSRLQLKDSSLAWHLLETHDKGCNNCSISSMASDVDGSVQNTDQDHMDSPTKNASEFEPALKKMLRQLCYTYLRFEECVELVGLICVEIDHKSKDNHSIKEVVRRGLAPKERTHERQQSDLEANEAEQVTLAMNRMARKDGCIVRVGGHDFMKGDGQVSAGDDAETVLSSNRAVSGSEIIVSASLHPADGQDPESRTSWEDGDEYSEATTPVCKDSSDTDNRCLAGPSEHGDPAYSISLSQTTEVYSQPLHSYDETDHAALTAGSQQADDSSSSLTCSKDLTHTLSSSWLTQNHGQLAICMSAGSPTHNREQCMSCLSGEVPNKVVVSGDGTVSHVVHNGPMSRQVYRIDLSNHEQSCEMDVDLDLHGSLVQPKDPAGEQSRDRAASIESTDSFMEVGIKSQINHAQRLLATPSPTDQSKPSPVPSPVVSLVADSSLRAAFDAFPPHPSETALSGDSLAMDCSPVHFDASSHPNHTSVIKQVNHPEKAASHKADPPACSTEVSFPLGEGSASPPRQSVSEGDLPLDMSVVKEEEDNTEHSVQDVRQGVKEGTTQQDEQSASHDTEDACSTSLSPPSSMHSEAAAAAAAARDTAQLLSSTSSMQHLQHYTDRLLQQHQQQRNLDMSLLHATFLSATDTEENTRSRKRKLSDLDDSRDGEMGKGSPWPRKDMTQKEEYQYLERDPFMDFAEMTRLFPNMQQRTFYRWKRKIKDQFIYVEQRPSLTYAEFSQYFPQVREHIFEHWRDLLSQGHRFLGDAGKSSSSFGDVSVLSGSLLKTSGGEGGSGITVKDGESGTKSDSYVSQYIFLQKHPNMDSEQFAEVYPEVPRELFCMWKKQIFADFLKLQTNPKLTYQEFRKQAAVTQDVFSLWKTHLMLMTNPSHLMSTCGNLVSATTSLTAAAPSLPPVSLLAARAGGKSLGADFAAWYASYAPLLGQMALPFWSPLSIISNPSLTTTFPTLRESSSVDRETDKDQSKVSMLDRLTDKELRKTVDSESSVAVDTGLPEKAGDAEGSSSPHPADREGTGEGSVGHRGRRQSLKPEHYYFLLNPDTPYLALTRLFPGVSAQRYGRWKRKVSSALAFLEREPDCSDGRFELYFPNVPDEILASWRERVRQGHSRLMTGNQESGEELSSQPLASTQPPASHHPVLASSSPALSGGHSRDSSVGGDAASTGEELLSRTSDSDKVSEQRLRDMTRQCLSVSSARKQHKANREEYLFVQRYPGVDLATFTSYYPTISVRTFYRWRAEVHKAIAMLRTKPSLNLHEFFSEFPILRERFPDLTEEVFATWQGMVKEEHRQETEGGSSASQGSGEEGAENLLVLSNASLLQQQQPHTEPSTEERETSSQQPVADDPQDSQAIQHEDSSQSHGDPSGGRSPLRQEQLLVHMNPYLEFSEMLRTYPSVTQRTFFRWKSEVRHVMDYMRKHPEVAYDDIASAVPGVSFQAFHMWQKLIMAENLQAHLEGKTKQNSRDHSGSQVVENRNETDSSGQSYQAVSESLSVDGSSQEKPDFGNRSSAAEAAEESFSMVGSEGDDHHAAKARRQTRDEFVEVMLNPAMDYAEFARRFGTVSQRTFYRWRAHIRDWRALIHADPQLDYATFSRHARDVPEHVFKIWREWDTRMENSHSQSMNEDLEGAQAESSQSSGGHSQLAPSTSSQAVVSGVSEVGKSGCKQLELIYMAYDYYQSHPTVDFKGLSAVFPSVSMDMFQQWKKAVDVWMEYIRRIPSTNFEDFHRIFPDVKENIFNILKANVLNEKSAGEAYYLAHSQSAADMSASCLPTLQTAYSSTSQPVFPQMAEVRVSAKQDEASDVSALQGMEGESAHQVVYSSAKPASTHSPHLQSSPAVGVQESLSVITPSVVNIKQEASPNTPLPSFTETVSNLSNLSRLNAMFQNRLPHTTSVVSTATPKPALLYPPHSTVTAPTTASSTATSVNSTFSTTLAGIVGDSVQKALSTSSTTASPAALYPSSQLYPSMSTTASETTNPAAYPVEEGDAGGSQGTTQLSVAYEDLAVGREERTLDMPGHSSQRQRKLQREEYMFVEQNPDVDVQEFLARFPKVSLRTFYRWKREIREEQARGIIGGLG